MTRELDRKPAVPFDLRKMTEARVSLGRFGAGLPTSAAQAFLLDHARARQAVWSEVDWLSVRAGQGLATCGDEINGVHVSTSLSDSADP